MRDLSEFNLSPERRSAKYKPENLAMAGFLRLRVAGDLCEDCDFAFRSLGKGMQDSSITIDMA
jgi:hypothetical protein